MRLRILGCGDYPGLSSWALNVITGVLATGSQEGDKAAGQGEERDGLMRSQEGQQPRDAGGDKEQILPRSLQREWTLPVAFWSPPPPTHFRLPASTNGREDTGVILSHYICTDLLAQQEKTDTVPEEAGGQACTWPHASLLLKGASRQDSDGHPELLL